jgi:hypothetical protein
MLTAHAIKKILLRFYHDSKLGKPVLVFSCFDSFLYYPLCFHFRLPAGSSLQAFPVGRGLRPSAGRGQTEIEGCHTG